MMTRAVTAAQSRRNRWPARTTLAVAAAVTVITGTALAATPKANAAGPAYPTGFAVESSTNTLAGVNFSNPSLTMWPGTSPSITSLPSDGSTCQTAYEGSNGDLWTAGFLRSGDLGLGMMPGTSPSITNLGNSPSAGYEIAFQANTGQLWTTGTAGTKDWGLPMAPHTSPSITWQASGGYEVAYQSNTTQLSVAGTTGTGGLGLGMQPGTSPSIVPNGSSYAIAFQANTGTLWTAGGIGTANTGLGMNTASSPSLMLPQDDSGYTIAFEANTNTAWVDDSVLGASNLGFAMRPGTSPSITFTSEPLGFDNITIGGYELAFQGANGDLWTNENIFALGIDNTSDDGVAMNSQSSPSQPES